MKQLFKSNKGLKVEEIPVPALTTGHILVRTLFSAISTGTETRLIKSDSNIKRILKSPKKALGKFRELSRYGITEAMKEYKYRKNKLTTIGYSSVGIVLEKAKDVTEIKVGDVVACGGYNFASHAEIITIPKSNIVKVSNKTKLEETSLAFIGGIAMHSVNLTKARKEDKIVIIGLGLIGQLISRILIAKGCKVFGLDLQAQRVSLAKNMFATTSEKELSDEVMKHNGADKIIIAATSKTSQPLNLALKLCNSRGTVVIAGNLPLNIDYSEFLKKELTISISKSAGRGKEIITNMKSFLNTIDKINFRDLIEVFDFNDFKNAFEHVIGGKSCSAILKYSGAPDMNTELTFKQIDNSKKNIAVVGLGRFAQNIHLPAITSTDDFNLYSVVSASGARAKELGLRFGASKCSTNLANVLSDKKTDLVYITSGDFQHAEHIIKAADAGKAIFCEKPLAITQQECKKIILAVKRNNVFFAFGLNRRHSDLAKFLKQLLVNEQRPINIKWHFNEILQLGDKKLINGAIRVGCHYVDLVCWLLDTEVDNVYTTGTDENFTAKAELKDGSVFTLSFATVFDAKWRERAEISTKTKDIIVNEFKNVEVFEQNGTYKRVFDDDKGYKEQIRVLHSALNGEKVECINLKQAVHSAEFGFAVVKGLKTKKKIRFELGQYF